MIPVRLAHFSDLHIAQPPRWRELIGRRAGSWVNLRLLGRGRRFRHAERVLAALHDDLAERRPDHLVFSGDATALGTEAEVARAAALLPLSLPGLAVPGNHDYGTPEAATGGSFERHFAAWQRGERIDAEVYPFAQRVWRCLAHRRLLRCRQSLAVGRPRPRWPGSTWPASRIIN